MLTVVGVYVLHIKDRELKKGMLEVLSQPVGQKRLKIFYVDETFSSLLLELDRRKKVFSYSNLDQLNLLTVLRTVSDTLASFVIPPLNIWLDSLSLSLSLS